MQAGIFTNGAYDVLGIIIKHQLIGIVVKTKYSCMYKRFEFVTFPEYPRGYGSWSDEKPQFVKRIKD